MTYTDFDKSEDFLALGHISVAKINRLIVFIYISVKYIHTYIKHEKSDVMCNWYLCVIVSSLDFRLQQTPN